MITRKQLEEQNKNLKDKCQMYEDYIIEHNGRPTLDRLNLNFAIEHTNDFLDIRTMADFEEALMYGKI